MQGQSIMEITYRTDQAFFEAYKTLKIKNAKSLFIQVVKIIALLTLIIINYVEYDGLEGDLPLCLALNITAAVLGLLLKSLLGLKLGDVGLYLTLAQRTNHLVEGQPLQSTVRIQDCVSRQIFLGETNLKREDLEVSFIKLNVAVTTIMIKNLLMQFISGAKNLENCYSLLSVGSMIYSIIVLIEGQTTINTVALSIYVAIVALSQLTIILILLLVALLPLIIILFCFYVCCSKGGQGQGQYIQLPSSRATALEMVNSGGDCPICRTSIDMGSKVYVLPCSQKHVFHQFCLDQWVKIKNTCPSCRAVIPTTNRARTSQLLEEAAPEQ